MTNRSPASWLVLFLVAVSLAVTALPAPGVPITQSAVTKMSKERASKSTRVVGWSAARRAASPEAALGALVVTGPGARPVRLEKRSGGSWKTVRTVWTDNDRSLDLASLARMPGTWRLVARHWRGWTGKKTSPIRIDAQEAITPEAPLLASAKPIKESPKGRTPGQTPNLEPTASFTMTVSNLSVAVDSAGSSDPDGTIASYALDLGRHHRRHRQDRFPHLPDCWHLPGLPDRHRRPRRQAPPPPRP